MWKRSLLLLRSFHKILMTVTITCLSTTFHVTCLWTLRWEWHKKTCFFQKHNLEALVVYLVCHLFSFFAIPFTSSQLSYPSRSNLTPTNFIPTFFSIRQHKTLGIFKFIQVLKGIEADNQRCSLKKSCSENFGKIRRKTPVVWSYFSQVAVSWRPIYKNRTIF